MEVISDLSADRKRLTALEKKRQAILEKKSAIKLALAAVDSSVKRKKIVFDKDDDQSNNKVLNSDICANEPVPGTTSVSKKKKLLFDEEDSADSGNEDDTKGFDIQKRFEGKKGQKLLELQSVFANDSRFKLDDRFYDEDSDANEMEDYSNSFQNEKVNQLGILTQVLGYDVSALDDMKNKSIKKPFLRFDPTKVECQKLVQEKKKTPKSNETIKKSHSQRVNKSIQKHKLSEKISTATKEKCFLVKDNLKDTISQEDQKSFSILELLGTKDLLTKESTEDYEVNKPENSSKMSQLNWISNPFKYDSSDSEEETNNRRLEELNVNTESNKATMHENFFFKADDPRLKEGLDFFSKNSVTDIKFDERKEELRRIARAKVRLNRNKEFILKKKKRMFIRQKNRRQHK